MGKQRLEAFTDGVLAVVITVMVLELRSPGGADAKALLAEGRDFLVYFLSFANVGIFWNNHHHMLHATERVDGRAMWANLFLLLWLSLIPFAIRWMEDARYAALPTAAYGVVLALAAIAYLVLSRSLSAISGNEALAEAAGSHWKERVSLLLYLAGIGAAFVEPWIAIALYILVALMWFVPDRRIEAQVGTR